MFIITLSAIALLLAVSYLLVVSYPFLTLPESFLAFSSYCFGQIVILSICLSETFGIAKNSILIGQFVMLALAVLAWNFTGRAKLFCLTRFTSRFKGSDPAERYFIGGLALITVALFALNVDFYRSFPSMNKDALSYHLPRAYFWLQQGSLHPLPVEDFRWTEFPPNSSILLMWMMAIGLGYEWMILPQVAGTVLIALAVYRLTTLCGGSRLAATSASLICAGFPALIYQVGTAGNDLLVGGLIASTVLFLAVALRPDNDRSEVLRSATLMGICAGLGLGTKLTFLMVVPGMAILVLWAFLILGWKEWRLRVLCLLVAGCLATFVFGGYGYIQNYRHFGSFTFSPSTDVVIAKQESRKSPRVTSPILSIYQTLSWHGVQSKPNEALPTLQRNIILALDEKLGLGLSKVDRFQNDSYQSELFTDENRAGYGVLGFLALLAAPGIGLWQVTHFFRTKRYVSLLQAGLILIGLSAFFLFCVNAPWTPTRPRYLIQYLPLLIPPFICAMVGPQWMRSSLYLIVSLFSLWVIFYSVNVEASRRELQTAAHNGMGPLQNHLKGRWLPQVGLLRAEKLTEATIGYAGRLDSWTFVLPREFPLNKYILLRPEEIEPALQSGKVNAAISELYPLSVSDSIPLPGTIVPPKQMIHLGNPKEFLVRNLNHYGISLDLNKKSFGLGTAAVETFANINQLWPTKLESDPRAAYDPAFTDSLMVLLPIGILKQEGSGFRVDIPLGTSFPNDQISGVTCNAQELAFTAKEDMLSFYIPSDTVEKNMALQACRIFFKNSLSVMLDGDSNFPGVGYFETPWTVTTQDN